MSFRSRYRDFPLSKYVATSTLMAWLLRGGHHCAQLLVRAMGVDGATRASLALYSLDHDVDALLNGLSELIGGKHRLAEG